MSIDTVEICLHFTDTTGQPRKPGSLYVSAEVDNRYGHFAATALYQNELMFMRKNYTWQMKCAKLNCVATENIRPLHRYLTFSPVYRFCYRYSFSEIKREKHRQFQKT